MSKNAANLLDGDRLIYTQAEELSLATVYRSQQLSLLNSRQIVKKWGNATLPFSSSSLPLPFPSITCREAAP